MVENQILMKEILLILMMTMQEISKNIFIIFLLHFNFINLEIEDI